MHKASNSRRFRSPDGLKSSVFKAIQNAGTIIENNRENVQCPVARIDDELEIGDFRIFGSNEINEQQKPIQKLHEKNNNENLVSASIFSRLTVIYLSHLPDRDNLISLWILLDRNDLILLWVFPDEDDLVSLESSGHEFSSSD
ncbi:unnamed protein product [Onchocerca ochengi]|uniref:Uncharacterized protein n=1 Tax=Onchocerca ochengi TaxID=42157 RepID=A0A182EI60_ONCOC|nr:unnamed protein product [Onchocerca ochengi]